MTSINDLATGPLMNAINMVHGTTRDRRVQTATWIADAVRLFKAWEDSVLASVDLNTHPADHIDVSHAHLLKHLEHIKANMLAIEVYKREHGVRKPKQP